MKWLQLLALAVVVAVVSSQLAEVIVLPEVRAPDAPRPVTPRLTRAPTLSEIDLARRFNFGASPVEARTTPAVRPASSAPLSLLGTLEHSREGGTSLASLTDTIDGRAHTLGIGEQLHDWEITTIDHGQVTLRHGDEELTLSTTSPRTKPAATPDVASLLAKLPPMPELMTSVQFFPAFENGVSAGVRVQRLVPGSYFAKLGLQQGDVLRTVNGKDPLQFDQLANVLLQAQTLDVVVDRGGQRLHLTVPVR